MVQAARGLRFLVLNELHTYRGRQGADVAMLVRRAREAFEAERLQCVGTSATLAGSGTLEEEQAKVSRIASGTASVERARSSSASLPRSGRPSFSAPAALCAPTTAATQKTPAAPARRNDERPVPNTVRIMELPPRCSFRAREASKASMSPIEERSAFPSEKDRRLWKQGSERAR